MLSNITIGQYFPTDSIIHRLNSAVKILLTVMLIVTVFLADSLVPLACLALVCIFIMLITKISIFTYLKMLKAILPIVILTALLNCIYGSGDELFSWWIFSVTYDGIFRAALICVRICLLVLISSVLTYTSSPTELTDGIEVLLSPLRFIGLGEAVHILALMTSITLRFIPILIEETDKIMSAQKARGADMESGSVLKRIKAMLPVLIPLLISATRRSIELADAMECRCYHGSKGRTKMKQSRFSLADFVSLLFVLCLLIFVIVERIIF